MHYGGTPGIIKSYRLLVATVLRGLRGPLVEVTTRVTATSTSSCY